MSKLGIKTNTKWYNSWASKRKFKYSIYVRYVECLQINVWIRYWWNWQKILKHMKESKIKSTKNLSHKEFLKYTHTSCEHLI